MNREEKINMLLKIASGQLRRDYLKPQKYLFNVPVEDEGIPGGLYKNGILISDHLDIAMIRGITPSVSINVNITD